MLCVADGHGGSPSRKEREGRKENHFSQKMQRKTFSLAKQREGAKKTISLKKSREKPLLSQSNARALRRAL
jgi:hypothetical protein